LTDTDVNIIKPQSSEDQSFQNKNIGPATGPTKNPELTTLTRLVQQRQSSIGCEQSSGFGSSCIYATEQTNKQTNKQTNNGLLSEVRKNTSRNSEESMSLQLCWLEQQHKNENQSKPFSKVNKVTRMLRNTQTKYTTKNPVATRNTVTQ
jgi:hypothetical protein